MKARLSVSAVVRLKCAVSPATGASRTWTYAYNTQGLLASVDGPRTDVSDVTSYSYDAADRLVVSKATVHRLVQQGKLRSVKIGRSRRIDERCQPTQFP